MSARLSGPAASDGAAPGLPRGAACTAPPSVATLRHPANTFRVWRGGRTIPHHEDTTMKTGTVKTLGAAALGVAFVGAAAGAASAAPLPSGLGLPDAATLPAAVPASVPVSGVAKAVPVDAVAGSLPASAKLIPGAQNTPQGVNTLLGGLPVGGQLGQLPLQGLPIGG